MSDVRPHTRQQAVLTAVLSWLVLAYIAGLGCACVCANSSQANASGLDADVTLSADLSAVDASKDIDARLLPALATIEHINSMATSERFEARGAWLDAESHADPIPRLQYAPKTSPPV